MNERKLNKEGMEGAEREHSSVVNRARKETSHPAPICKMGIILSAQRVTAKIRQQRDH